MKENNNGKKINSSLIQESLIDYNNLAKKLNESTPEIIKNILNEQVRQAYASILNESDDEDIEDTDYDIEEVDDTTSEPAENDNNNDVDNNDTDVNADVDNVDTEDGMNQVEDDAVEPANDVDSIDDSPIDDEEDGMGQEFDKYKTEDGAYDLSNAEDDEIVKVYKRLKDTDGVTVVPDGNKVQISDNETGAEYIIDMSGDGGESTSDIVTDDINNTDDMNESRIFEIALNEYDSHVGYTDNYQKKDVMTNSGVSEPGKGRDIDAGVPQNTQKPWSKQKKSVGPFNGKKGKTVECGDPAVANNAPEIDEHNAGGRMGAMGRMTGVKTHRPNSGNVAQPEGQHNVSVAGEYKGKPSQNESIIKKANKIFEDNKRLTAELDKLTKYLQEAAVTNVNLGGIIKLMTENSTTKEEKKQIVNRFTNEAHTVEQSKALYESIANDLKKKPQVSVNINEEKQFVNEDSKVINESKFYQDESLMGSLGLMHKICK